MNATVKSFFGKIIKVLALSVFLAALIYGELSFSCVAAHDDGLKAEETAVKETYTAPKKKASLPDVALEMLSCYSAKVTSGAGGIYSIRVNLGACTVTVYENMLSGNEVPVLAFLCSASETTPTGEYSLKTKLRWGALYGGVYGQYAMRITGAYLFHSVPYYSMNPDDLEYEEFNKLGENVSMGCVRLTVADVKWIYDNCALGTPVEIYSDEEEPGPLGRPEAVRLNTESKYRGWDPTDPDPENPWHSLNIRIKEGADETVHLIK